MAVLFDKIRVLVMTDRYVISHHAVERLDERGILEWQVVDGIEQGMPIREDLDALPNPSVEVRQVLADGTVVKAVWSHMVLVDIAKLVTIHFLK